MDLYTLADVSCTGWIMDLRYTLLHLATPVVLPLLAEIDANGLKVISEKVTKSMKSWLNNEMNSPKMYLLQG